MQIDTVSRTTELTRRVAAVAFFAFSSALGLHAQQSATPAAVAAAPVAVPAGTFAVPALDLSSLREPAYSSSADGPDASQPAEAATLDPNLLTLASLQPPPRRRYGRPRYNDSSHNPDGSNKYAFLAGIGLTQPTGNTYHYDTPSYSYQVGVGRNFNKNFATFFQFDWDNFGYNGRTIYNQTLVENYIYGSGSLGTVSFPVDGNSHVWSFSLDPTYNIYAREGLGAYVVGGVGFYHKVATFFTPVEEEEQTVIGTYAFEANQTIDHYSSNAVGFNGGFGLTYKPSRFANEKLYAEVRYVFVDNSQRQGYTVNTVSSAPATATNFFPANSNRTTYIPIKFGIRF